MSLFCYALLCVHSSFAIILKRKRKLVALLLLSYRCFVTINVLGLFLTVPWDGLQFVIEVFHDHAHCLLCVKHSANALKRLCILLICLINHMFRESNVATCMPSLIFFFSYSSFLLFVRHPKEKMLGSGT